ncbi:hypothetical protein ACFXGR_22235 [Streptomyces mirabilis]|uniref:hypothetical protein n=1 Tax=Streptomyces mirabilis TaxID=68239 RepID=UPI0036C95AE5
MSSVSQTPEQMTFVVMLGNVPMAAASSLDAAKDEAFARETKYRKGDEYHWTEFRPGEWRLMARSEDRKRFSWTQYWVATVPSAEGGAR